jgi:hypothetical protein
MYLITWMAGYTISDHKRSGNKSDKNITNNNLNIALQTKLSRVI